MLNVRALPVGGAGLGFLMLFAASSSGVQANPTTMLLYRPVSSSVPVSAYFDLNQNCDAWLDWHGHTNLDFGVYPDCSTGYVGWVDGHTYDQHEGTDYNGALGDSVGNAQRGTVTDRVIDCSNTYPAGPLSYGTYIRINHGQLADGNSYRTLYAHLRCDRFLIPNGTDLHRTSVQIAEMGNTGYSSGPHTHLNVYRNNMLIDPYANEIISDSPPQIKPPAAILYEHANYQGHSLVITESDDDLCDNPIDPTQPPVVPCFSVPSWNDVASSIRVMPGYQIWLYLHSREQERILGEYHIVRNCSSDIPDFSDPSWNFPNGASLNDNVSRVVVQRCPGGNGQSQQGNGFSNPATTDPCEPAPPISHDNATFVADAALPDGSMVNPCQSYVKTWRMRISDGTT